MAATVLPGSFIEARPAHRITPLEAIRFEDFVAELNTSFTLLDAGEAVTLRLVETQTRPAGDHEQLTESFSLFFAGPTAHPLSQDTYLFEHSAMGRFRMFISRVGRPEHDEWLYEAVFNRPLPHARTSPGQAGHRNARHVP